MALENTYTTLQEPTRNELVPVGTTSVTAAFARQGGSPRKVITVRNISPNATDIITVNIGPAPAVANTGIVLRQNESFTDAMDGAYYPYQGTITASCATATGQLAIFER